jgi:hypothetical protein
VADTQALEALTKAQVDCLRILADRPLDDPFGGWCNYGTACGVKRNVVRALETRGLAQLDDHTRPGVSARITPAGRAALTKGGAND